MYEEFCLFPRSVPSVSVLMRVLQVWSRNASLFMCSVWEEKVKQSIYWALPPHTEDGMLVRQFDVMGEVTSLKVESLFLTHAPPPRSLSRSLARFVSVSQRRREREDQRERAWFGGCRARSNGRTLRRVGALTFVEVKKKIKLCQIKLK